jgi:hypothetical protein
MKLPVAVLCIATALAAAAPAMAAAGSARTLLLSASTARLSAGDMDRIGRGETVFMVEDSGRGDRRIRFAGAINGRPDEVYGALSNLDKYAEVLPAYFTDSAVRSRGENEAIAYFRFRTYWPFPDRAVTNKYVLDPDRKAIAWLRVGGSVLKNDGSVSVRPYGADRSLVDFRVAVDPGIPFIPAWIFDDWAARQVVPGVLTELDRYLSRTRTASR